MNSLQLFLAHNLGSVSIGAVILGFVIGFNLVAALWVSLDGPNSSKRSNAGNWIITAVLSNLAIALIMLSPDPMQVFIMGLIGGFVLVGAAIGLFFCGSEPCSELADFEPWARPFESNAGGDLPPRPHGMSLRLTGPQKEALRLPGPSPKALPYIPASAVDSGSQACGQSPICRK